MRLSDFYPTNVLSAIIFGATSGIVAAILVGVTVALVTGAHPGWYIVAVLGLGCAGAGFTAVHVLERRRVRDEAVMHDAVRRDAEEAARPYEPGGEGDL